MTFPAVIELSDLNGNDGFVIKGASSGDKSGHSVSTAGDFNGDGIDDLLVGAWYADPGGRDRAGASYVIFGQAGLGNNGVIELSGLNDSTGLVLNGVSTLDYSGHILSDAGDVNDDGWDDVVVASRFASPGGRIEAGTSYVVFGGVGVGGVMELSSLDGENGFVLNGVNEEDWSARPVSSAGDVNGDGVDDLIIGAYRADPGGRIDAGASYVVFGQTGLGAGGVIELSRLNGTNGFAIYGINTGDWAGVWVSPAGDVNGDGVSDIIIGASQADPGGRADAGASYVVFGRSNIGGAGVLELSHLDGSNGFVLNGVDSNDRSGSVVSCAGDINADGFDDLLIGASAASPGGRANAGAVYVVFGQTEIGRSGVIELSSLNGSNGFIMHGVNSEDWSGASVSAAGDVNWDGVDDIVVGATYASPAGRVDAGVSYVVFGQAGLGSDGVLELSELNGSNGFVLRGVNEKDRTGRSVSNAGDVNGDGVDDIIVGTDFGNSGERTNAGASYVIFGRIILTLSTNRLLLNQGERLLITQKELETRHPKLSPDMLNVVVSDVEHGQFEFVAQPGEPITRFPQSAIDAGEVVFAHDGGVSEPSYKVHVSYNQITTASEWAVVTFNLLPELLTYRLVLHQGETKVLSPNELNASDIETVSDELVFLMSDVQGGYFDIYSNPGQPLLEFRQYYVRSGAIRFIHDGSRQEPSVYVRVRDGSGAETLPVLCEVNFVVGPRLEINAFVLEEGERLVLDEQQLKAADAESDDAALTFEVSQVTGGQFELVSAPGVAIYTFFQSQVSEREVVFAHDGSSEDMPHFAIQVDNGQIKTQPMAANIDFHAIAPVVVRNQLMVDDGVVVRLSTAELFATDGGEARDDIVFQVEGVEGGYFELYSNPGVDIIQFTQEKLKNRNVQFVPTSQGIAPSYNLTVSDGLAVSAVYMANITFNGAPHIVTNGFWVNQGQWVALNDSMLAVVDRDNIPVELMWHISDLSNGWFRWAGNSSRITAFTQADIDGRSVVFEADDTTAFPQYAAYVSDGRITTPPQDAEIDYNRAPRVERLPQNQDVFTGEAFDFRLDGLTFSDPDPEDSLTVAASLSSGDELPTGITFEASELRFTGKLSQADSYDIQLNAADEQGLTAQTGFGLRATQKTEARQWWQTFIGPGLAVTALTTVGGLVWRRRKQRQYRKQHEIADALRRALRLTMHDFSHGDGARFVDLVEDLMTKLRARGLVADGMVEEQRAQLVRAMASACESVEGMIRPGDCIGRRHNRQQINLAMLRKNLDMVAERAQGYYNDAADLSSVTAQPTQPGVGVELQTRGTAEGEVGRALHHNPAALFSTPADTRNIVAGELSRSETPPPPPVV